MTDERTMMTDERVVEFKRPDEPNIRQDLVDNIALGAPITLSNGGSLEVTAEGLGFTDLDAALNMRDWLEQACMAVGAKRVGGGIGFGQADIDIELENCRFNISIRPLQQS